MGTRIDNPIDFRQSLSAAEYAAPEIRTAHQTRPGQLLPSRTSVSELIRQVFDTRDNVDGQVMDMLEKACTDPALRSPAAFQEALRNVRAKLKEKRRRRRHDAPGDGDPQEPDEILDELIENKDLLDYYRATILE